MFQECIIVGEMDANRGKFPLSTKFFSIYMAKVSLNLPPKNYQMELIYICHYMRRFLKSLWNHKLSIYETTQKKHNYDFLLFSVCELSSLFI